MALLRSSKRVAPTAVFQKISKEEKLTKEDKKFLMQMIKVAEKARKGKPLSNSDQRLIKQFIQETESGNLDAMDFIRFGTGLLNIKDILELFQT